MTNETLAILGGEPSRTKPFLVEPMTGVEEEEMALAAIRDKNFSRYIGMAVDESVLRMTSADAAAVADYWHVLGGPNVRAFASEFAREMKVPFAIPVSSATVGLSVALAAAGVGPGDEVILPAISFSATALAPLMFNSIPVFVDVDPETFCMDPALVEHAITPATKAILVTHLAGNIADMDALLRIARNHNLRVIEDAAQAIGAKYCGLKAGAIGDAGVFSFQQSKNIMTGEGGMVITHDPEIARRARLITNHGELQFDDVTSDDELANVVGFNFRMPELCAAVGRAQLRKLGAVNDWRVRNFHVLCEELSNLPGIRVAQPSPDGDDNGHAVPHFLVALYDESAVGVSRASFVAALRAEGIPVGTGYSRTLYENPTFLRKIAYGRNGAPWTSGDYKGSVTYKKGQCPIAESLLKQKFLWFYHIAHSCTEADMRDIGTAVRKVVASREALAAKDEVITSQTLGHSAGRIGVDPKVVRGPTVKSG